MPISAIQSRRACAPTLCIFFDMSTETFHRLLMIAGYDLSALEPASHPQRGHCGSAATCVRVAHQPTRLRPHRDNGAGQVQGARGVMPVVRVGGHRDAPHVPLAAWVQTARPVLVHRPGSILGAAQHVQPFGLLPDLPATVLMSAGAVPNDGISGLSQAVPHVGTVEPFVRVDQGLAALTWLVVIDERSAGCHVVGCPDEELCLGVLVGVFGEAVRVPRDAAERTLIVLAVLAPAVLAGLLPADVVRGGGEDQVGGDVAEHVTVTTIVEWHTLSVPLLSYGWAVITKTTTPRIRIATTRPHAQKVSLLMQASLRQLPAVAVTVEAAGDARAVPCYAGDPVVGGAAEFTGFVAVA